MITPSALTGVLVSYMSRDVSGIVCGYALMFTRPFKLGHCLICGVPNEDPLRRCVCNLHTDICVLCFKQRPRGSVSELCVACESDQDRDYYGVISNHLDHDALIRLYDHRDAIDLDRMAECMATIKKRWRELHAVQGTVIALDSQKQSRLGMPHPRESSDAAKRAFGLIRCYMDHAFDTLLTMLDGKERLECQLVDKPDAVGSIFVCTIHEQSPFSWH